VGPPEVELGSGIKGNLVKSQDVAYFWCLREYQGEDREPKSQPIRLTLL